MNSYTVQQISNILGTNPETVRRWIRNDQLKAIQSSRKSGSVVEEAELIRFLKSSPKYWQKALSYVISLTAYSHSPIVGLAAFAGALGFGALQYYKSKTSLDTHVCNEATSPQMQDALHEIDKQIEEKRSALIQLQTEIAALHHQHKVIEMLLDSHDSASSQCEKATGGNAYETEK